MLASYQKSQIGPVTTLLPSHCANSPIRSQSALSIQLHWSSEIWHLATIELISWLPTRPQWRPSVPCQLTRTQWPLPPPKIWLKTSARALIKIPQLSQKSIKRAISVSSTVVFGYNSRHSQLTLTVRRKMRNHHGFAATHLNYLRSDLWSQPCTSDAQEWPPNL